MSIVLVFFIVWDVRPPTVPLSNPIIMDTYVDMASCENSLRWLERNYPAGHGECWREMK